MTAQIAERLLYNGEKMAMTFCPPVPEMHPRIIQGEWDKTLDHGILYSTACWRRYQGTWEIRDSRLYLVDLRGRFRLQGDGPLFADWFTGVLRIPQGEMLYYIHMGFGSKYEEDLHLKVENGRIISSHVIDNRGRKYDRWEESMKNLPSVYNDIPGDGGSRPDWWDK